MATSKLETSEWRWFFDAVSKSLVGKRAEIEAASLELGDQVEAEWLPLHGIRVMLPPRQPAEAKSGGRGAR